MERALGPRSGLVRSESSSASRTHPRRSTIITGLLTALLGPIALTGWITGNVALTSVLPGLVPMNPLTALCFSATGIALALLGTAEARAGKTIRVLSGLVLVVALLRVVGDLLSLPFAIDQVLFHDALARVPHGPNRMAPNTATAFVMTTLSILLIDVETARGHRPSQYLALAPAVISLLAMTGYAYGEPRLIAVRAFLPMALNTATGFAILAGGILWARADGGFMRVITSPYAGGTTVRRLLPAAILIPWALGWLQLTGQRLALFAHESGLALTAVATMFVLAVIVWWTGRSVEEADEAQRRAQTTVVASEARLRAILDNTTALVSMKDRMGRYLFVNRRFAEVIDRDRADVTGCTDHEVFPEMMAEAYRANDLEVLSAGTPIEFEETVPHGDDPHTYVAIKFPLAAAGEHPYALCSIATDITARKHLAETLEERTRALEIANGDLEAFNYSVSHDLRAPLRAIDGFARILAEDHATRLDDEARRALGMITDGAHQMGRLIENLLKFARCGRQGLERTPVDMAALVEAVSRELRLIDGGRGVTLTILPLPNAAADSGMLRHVISNLLSNAWKFTAGRANAMVTVGARTVDGETVYYVQDNGAGFDSVHAGKLFGVFQRLHAASEFDGTGIGLAIVRRIIERHGGRVWAEGYVGAGATFSFTLPNAAPSIIDFPTPRSHPARSHFSDSQLSGIPQVTAAFSPKARLPNGRHILK